MTRFFLIDASDIFAEIWQEILPTALQQVHQPVPWQMNYVEYRDGVEVACAALGLKVEIMVKLPAVFCLKAGVTHALSTKDPGSMVQFVRQHLQS